MIKYVDYVRQVYVSYYVAIVLRRVFDINLLNRPHVRRVTLKLRDKFVLIVFSFDYGQKLIFKFKSPVNCFFF